LAVAAKLFAAGFLRSLTVRAATAWADFFFAETDLAARSSALECLSTILGLTAELLAFGLLKDFFVGTDPAFASSFLGVNSKAGLGTARSFGPTRVSNAAGFTPAAAAAAFAMLGFNGACLAARSISGFTMI
jgi:hypothetical protein